MTARNVVRHEDAPTLAQAQRDEHDMNTDPTTVYGALTQAIFAINTLLHPDASHDDDVAAFEVDAEQVLALLVELRTALYPDTHDKVWGAPDA